MWWWGEKIQRCIKAKKTTNKAFDETNREEDRIMFKIRKKEAKRAVAIARVRAWGDDENDVCR